MGFGCFRITTLKYIPGLRSSTGPKMTTPFWATYFRRQDSKHTMPEPLKNLYSIDLVESLCGQVKGQYCGFDADGFVQHVMDNEWENKELKERMKHISESLHQYLPMQYSEAVQILIKAASKLNGFQYMFFPGFVELYGLDEYEE